MNLIYGSITALLVASGTTHEGHEPHNGSSISAEVNACARKIGAQEIASSLKMIPKEIRADLEQRIEARL